ncbi:hypothetical protein LFM09_27160 [Lentzea alba]|uniref:hypothetical protein n=1 Tax=Lentzea alba TaxID=2714351 RepID=UPI0039BEFF80
MRALLVAGLLLVAGCTSQPVSAPPSSTVPQVSTTAPTTSGPATSEPTAEPPTEQPQPVEPAALGPGCADVAPSDVLSEITGEPVPDANESRRGDVVVCSFGAWEITFTSESDEATFAQRRDGYVSVYSTRPDFTELPDLFDEAYRTGAGYESMAHTVLAARRGSDEVWISAYASGPWIYPARDALFAAVFERLG